MTDNQTQSPHWDDVDMGARIASGSLALIGALLAGPIISTTIAEFVGQTAIHFHGEEAVLFAKIGAVAASWGFIFGALFGASGWLRHIWMPKLRAKFDAKRSNPKSAVIRQV